MAIPAPACKKALADATAKWPQRNRASDGILGDSAHQARKSDHNLGNAYDLTHDPAHGVDCAVLSRLVLNDPRVTYVIFNKQINSKDGRGWRSYTGKNGHTHHMHVSIRTDARDNLSAWPWSDGSSNISNNDTPKVNGTNYPGSVIKKGHVGEIVGLIQRQLNSKGAQLAVDNNFGDNTHNAVMAFQVRSNLFVDGIVGQKTWATLFTKQSIISKAPPFKGNLQQGSRGDAVTQLQKQLNTKGAIPKLSADGIFGPKTRNAVITFQRKSAIPVDGIVGDKTWAKLWG